jgi:hypothetical protein
VAFATRRRSVAFHGLTIAGRTCVALIDRLVPQWRMVSRNQPRPLESLYRLVVKAREASRPKDFIWQIVRNTRDGEDPVQETSPRTFTSMAAAYEHGDTAFRSYRT